jgi:hypothetical protein
MLTRGLATALALAPMLAMTVQASPPPEPEALRVEVRPLEAPARVEAIIPVQGRLTDASGKPVADADYNMTFRVYDGSGLQCADGPTAVHTEHGLFNANLSGCSPDIFDGRFLTLGVQVGGDAEMTPVLVLRPVPYAMSLRPGSIVANYEAGHALTAKSTGAGGASSALRAESSNTGSGIAIWGKAAGTDATVVIENAGTGPLFKGFGGDGGEDELTITNGGAFLVKPDSHITVPGVTAVLGEGTTNTLLAPQADGSVKVTATYSPIDSTILIGIPLPAVLYGQNLDFEALTVFYRTTTALSYIDSFALNEIGYPGGGTTIITGDTTNLNSTTYAAYQKSIGHSLASAQAFVVLALQIHFNEDLDSLYIGGVTLQVGHHPMY